MTTCTNHRAEEAIQAFMTPSGKYHCSKCDAKGYFDRQPKQFFIDAGKRSAEVRKNNKENNND